MSANDEGIKLIRPRTFLPWLVPPALCALLGVVFSTQEYFMAARKGEAVTWVGAFFDLMPYWLFWALLSPLIGWLATRYPIEKGRWLSSLLIHLAVSIPIASLYPLLYILVWVANSFNTFPPAISGRLHLFFFINAHVFGIVTYWVILTIILMLNYYRRYQEERLSAARLEAQLKNAELQALRMQLHPHFLPNLILQPLVENAVRHGIAMQSSAGTITLKAIRLNQELHLEISNDGPGLPPDWHKAGEDGTGLKNTRARLKQLYGSGYAFDISDIKNRGTVATLKLPFRIAGEAPSQGQHGN